MCVWLSLTDKMMCLFAVQRSGLQSPLHLRHASFLELRCEGKIDLFNSICVCVCVCARMHTTSLMRFQTVRSDTVTTRPRTAPPSSLCLCQNASVSDCKGLFWTVEIVCCFKSPSCTWDHAQAVLLSDKWAIFLASSNWYTYLHIFIKALFWHSVCASLKPDGDFKKFMSAVAKILTV